MRSKSFLLVKLLLILIMAIFIIIIIRMFSGYFSSSVDAHAKSTVKNYAEGIIIQSIESEILETLDDSHFLVEHYDNDGKVSYAYLDTKKINKIRNDIADYLDNVVDDLPNYEALNTISIPLGYFFGTKYFLDKDISMPLHIETIGNQDVDIKREIISEGINTTIMEFYLKITIDIMLIMPLKNMTLTTEMNIPLSIEIMNNEIPYYLSDIS